MIKTKFIGVALIAAFYAPLSNAVTVQAQLGHSKPTVVVEGESLNTNGFTKKLGATGVVRVLKGSCAEFQKSYRREFVCAKDVRGGIGVGVYRNGGVLTTLSQNKALQKAYSLATGEADSPFSSPIAMVAKAKGSYMLMISDFMGQGRRILHRSESPLLSPEWSPSGRYITYLSFETGRAAIYVQDVITEKRIRVYSKRGLNGYPSFLSEHELLVSVSGESVNSDIIKLNLFNKKESLIVKSSNPEIYPKPIDGGVSFLKMFGDLPYLYTAKAGALTKLFERPLHAFDASRGKGCWVGSSARTFRIFDGRSMEAIEFSEPVESPTIMDNCQFSFAISDEGENSHIIGFNVNREKAFTIKINGVDLIQVSAY